MEEKKKVKDLPEIAQLEKELRREISQNNTLNVVKSTIYILIVAAAVAVLIATLWVPVLQIYGSSMTPTLSNGEVVVALKGSDFKFGDIIAFYYNNKILVKRCIAGPGDWVDIDDDGNVSVNGTVIDEPYVEEKSKGECDIKFPYQVPDERYFVLGDHRDVSVDSRSTLVGCVSDEQIVGRIVFVVMPLSEFGSLS